MPLNQLDFSCRSNILQGNYLKDLPCSYSFLTRLMDTHLSGSDIATPIARYFWASNALHPTAQEVLPVLHAGDSQPAVNAAQELRSSQEGWGASHLLQNGQG